MNKDLKKACAILAAQGYTCVLCKEEAVYTSTARGVRPLVEFLDSGVDFHSFSAADKVIGKATAFLYCLLGVKEVYAQVISRSALQVLEDHGIAAGYDILTDAIFNHRKDGFCPMETATKNISDPQEALAAIRRTMEILRAKNS